MVCKTSNEVFETSYGAAAEHEFDEFAKSAHMLELEAPALLIKYSCRIESSAEEDSGRCGGAEPGDFCFGRSSAAYSRAHVGKLNFVMLTEIFILRLVISPLDRSEICGTSRWGALVRLGVCHY